MTFLGNVWANYSLEAYISKLSCQIKGKFLKVEGVYILLWVSAKESIVY